MTDLTVIIPAYNRVSLLNLVLQKLLIACRDIHTEILIVDDGSEPELRGQIVSDSKISILRQENSGLVYAKYNGLLAAKGEYVLFLDSDDFIAENKLELHLREHKNLNVDIVYSDSAKISVSKDGSLSSPFEQNTLKETSNVPELFLSIQPLPHSISYRREYLLQNIKDPIIPLNSIFNHIGEVWFYYNLACSEASISKINEFLNYVSIHEEERITSYWERLGFSSLALMKHFIVATKGMSEAHFARMLVGEACFIAWRKLPRKMNKSFENEFLTIWRSAPQRCASRLGGSLFYSLSKVFGVVLTARLLKIWQRPGYSEIATLDNEQFQKEIEKYNDYSSVNSLTL